MRHKDPIFQVKVDATRAGVMKTMRDIEAGCVNAEDLEKLNNFLQFALALMQAEGPKKWELAKMNAELMNYMKD